MRSPVDEAQVVAREVNVWTAKYARKCPWVDEAELRGEAWLAALDARDHYDAERGPFGAYIGSAVRRTLAGYVLRFSSPVSATNRGTARAMLYGLRGAGLAALDGPAREGDAEGGGAAAEERVRLGSSGLADDALDDRGWRTRVAARLLELVGPDELDAMLDGGRDGARASVVWRRVLAGDAELRALWEERNGR